MNGRCPIRFRLDYIQRYIEISFYFCYNVNIENWYMIQNGISKDENSRVYYIDNLRWMSVSLLILFHASVAYNTWGEANYIFLGPVKSIASIVTFISPWFMPLMFLLAGVSARYSLKKRGYKAFIRERLLRLGIPLFFGLLVLNPALSYIADKSHNGYTGGYFEHYSLFFTRITDLTGYDGGFTLGHLWFILILLLLSILSCIVTKTVPENKTAVRVIEIVLSALAIATFDIKFFGKPLLMFFCVYLLGYYLFGNPDFVEKLSKFKWIFATLFLVVSVLDIVLYIYVSGYEILNTVCYYVSFVTGILAFVALGHDYLDFSNRFTAFQTSISYVFYIVHFPIVTLFQYALSICGANIVANFLLTITIVYPLTYGICFLITKTRFVRVLFGLKIKKADRK